MIVDAVVSAASLTLVVMVGAYLVGVTDRATAHVVAHRPLRVGHLLADPVRRAAALMLQGHSTTERPDAGALAFAPVLLGGAGLAAIAAIPLTDGVAVADIPDGIALYGAALAMVLVAVFLHGWAPNSPFPLLGAYRFAAQALSYPIPFVLTLISTALKAQSLSVGGIVASQAHLWNVLRQPIGLPLFLVTGGALAFWGPFDLPDAADLAGGTTAEISGRALLAWQIARATVLVSVAAMAAAAFLGGGFGPALPAAVWMALKTLVVLVVLVAGGHLVARVRIERFVTVCWTVLIPLALVDVFVSGALAL